MSKSVKPALGSGERFVKLEKSIASKGDVEDSKAVAAAIGRKKYGEDKMEKMAKAGKSKKKK